MTLTRQRFLQGMGAGAAALAAQLAALHRAATTTWSLHGDSDRVGLGKL